MVHTRHNTPVHKKPQLTNTTVNTVTTVHKKKGQRANRLGRLAEQYSKDKKNKNMNLREERNFLDLPCVTVIKDLRSGGATIASSNSPDLI